MRVLHVNKFLYRRGGAEGYLFDVADLQRRSGDEVAFFGMTHADNEPGLRYAAVHLHNVYHQLSPSVVAATAKAGVPCVMTLHDYKLACPSYQMLDKGQPCDACVTGGPPLVRIVAPAGCSSSSATAANAASSSASRASNGG